MCLRYIKETLGQGEQNKLCIEIVTEQFVSELGLHGSPWEWRKMWYS